MDITSVLRTKIKFPVRLKSSKKFFEQASGLGLLGAIGILTISLVLPALFLISISIENSYEGLMFVMLIMVMMSYGLAAFVPALWLGTKQGWKEGVKVIIFEVTWLLVSFLLLVPILSSIRF